MRAAAVLLSVLFLAMTISPLIEVGPVDSLQAPESIPAGWWDTWIRDKNHDRLDDLLLEEEFPASVLVDYHRRPTDNDISALEALGLDITYRCKYIDTVIVSGVERKDLLALSLLPGVAMVEADVEVVAAMNVASRASKVRDNDLYPAAWELGVDGTGINVAVVDSGVDDAQHQDFPDKFVGGGDFSNIFPRENVNPDDTLYHGTFVAGTLLGTGDAQQEGGENKYTGIAPGAKLVDVKVLSDRLSLTSYLITGLEWCIEQRDNLEIQIVSMSITVGGNDQPVDSDGTGSHCDAANAVVDSGMIIVTAMGNEGMRLVPAPASADGAIAVGSVNDHDTIDRSDDTWEEYSNYGPRVRGNNTTTIEDMKPDLVASGDFTAPRYNTEDEYWRHDGTSFSAPIVSGVIALMLEANPFLSIDDVKTILRETAEQRGTPYNTSIDPKYNTTFGWGIVDGRAAVEMALATPHPDLNLTITNTTETSLALSWEEYMGTGFDSYKIFVYDEDEPGAVPTKTVSSKGGTSTTISGLSAGTNYTVLLRISTWANDTNAGVAEIATPGTAPPPPEEDNIAPDAHIDEISPSEIDEGDSVYFEGRGTDVDGTIVGYLWESSLDGELSTEDSFATTELSAGDHEISFKVQDNGSKWSNPVQRTVTVSAVQEDNDPPIVSITNPASGTRIDKGETLTIKGTAWDDHSVWGVFIAIEGGNMDDIIKEIESDGSIYSKWIPATGTTSWTYELDLSNLEPGEYTITAMAADKTGQESEEDVIVIKIEDTKGFSIGGFLTEPINLGLIGIIAAVAVLLILFKRGKKKQMVPVSVVTVEPPETGFYSQ